MKLEGSCHCGAVRFAVESHTPHPYMHCHCSICRKTAGGGGYVINIMADAASLEVTGTESLRIYQARLEDGSISESKRHFCAACASYLWAADERWPDWIYPFASAIDTPLPKSPAREHIFLDAAAPWIGIPDGADDPNFVTYPALSIEDWHRGRGLYLDD